MSATGVLLLLLGIAPSYAAFLIGMVPVFRAFREIYPMLILVVYLLSWALSLLPTLLFIFRRASPQLQALGYPGYQKGWRRNAR